MRQIDFYATAVPKHERVCGRRSAYNYRSAERMVESGESFQTTQMCMLNDPYVLAYDRLVIHENGKPDIVIDNNHDGTWECDRTERQLRHGHNLFRLWRAGEFD